MNANIASYIYRRFTKNIHIDAKLLRLCFHFESLVGNDGIFCPLFEKKNNDFDLLKIVGDISQC